MAAYHTGKTGPCSQALIDAGVARVVVACTDPDPRVSGSGIRMLKDAGIAVTEGVREDEALALNAGFISRVTRKRPEVLLKIASTLDGKIATPTGKSHWITGEMARERTHLVRAQTDAIMVGSATALADNPDLPCNAALGQQLKPRRHVHVIVGSKRHINEFDTKISKRLRPFSIGILTGEQDQRRLQCCPHQ